MSTARVLAELRRVRSMLVWFTRDDRLVAFLDPIQIVPRARFSAF